MNPDQTPTEGVAAVTAHPHRDTIVVLDYGSQYARLIVRRVRECRVYAELLPWDAPADRIRALNPRGIILSGGPNSVYDPGAPTLQDTVLNSSPTISADTCVPSTGANSVTRRSPSPTPGIRCSGRFPTSPMSG